MRLRRLSTLLGATVVVGAAAQACSFFVPFDDYRHPKAPGDDAASDSTTEAASVDGDSPDASDGCSGCDADAAAAPQLILSTTGASAIAVEPGYLYFTTDADAGGSLFRAALPTDGGGAARVSPAVASAPSLLVYGGFAYWRTLQQAEVQRAAKSSSVDAATTWLSGTAYMAFTIDPTDGRLFASDFFGNVVEQQLPDASVRSVGDVGCATYGIGRSSGSAHVYVSCGTGNVFEVERGDGAVRPFAQGQGKPGKIAVDGARVAWINTDAPQGLYTRLPPGSPQLVAPGDVRDLAFSGGFLYWIDADGDVKKSDDPTKAAVTLATGPSNPNALAIDESYVYWTASDGIHRVGK